MSANITETQSFVRMPELDTSTGVCLCCTCDSEGLSAEVRRRGRGEVSGSSLSSSVGAQRCTPVLSPRPSRDGLGRTGGSAKAAAKERSVLRYIGKRRREIRRKAAVTRVDESVARRHARLTACDIFLARGLSSFTRFARVLVTKSRLGGSNKQPGRLSWDADAKFIELSLRSRVDRYLSRCDSCLTPTSLLSNLRRIINSLMRVTPMLIAGFCGSDLPNVMP